VSARPDIVLLVLDTQRVDRLSCFGHARETSPSLDALAADATRFTHAVAPAQWTIPSHTSMFTGQYPAQHQTVQPFHRVPSAVSTLAERLHAGGYFTAAMCNNPLVGVVNNGLRRGFQSFLNYSGLMTSRPNQAAVGRGPMDRYRQQFKRVVVDAMTSLQDVFARSDAMLEFSFNPLMRPLWQTALSFKGNTAKSLRDAAQLLTTRREVARDQPIFCFVNLMGTHIPYHPSLRNLERFAPLVRKSKVAQRYLRQFNGDVFGWLTPLAADLDDETRELLRGVYDAGVADQDELLGVFFDQLRASGSFDRTQFIICADHGEHLGEKRFLGHSFSVYNELVHVPLIIRDPSGDLPRGADIAHVVSTRRIFHTALTTAGVATDDERRLTLAVDATDSPERDPEHGQVFAEAIPIQNVLHLLQRRRPALISELACDQPRRAVWNGRFKLAQTGERHAELYNSYDDPKERLDLGQILPEEVETMQEMLGAFVQRNAAARTGAADDPGADAAAPTLVPDYDDPQVQRRLHDLGYLE